MIGESFAAMGTTVDVYAEDVASIEATRELFAEVEAICSRFLPDSELSAINRRCGFTVQVSPLMRQILETAANLYRRTDGLVDPAVGGRVAEWGYDRTFDEVADRSDRPPDRAVGRWDLVGDILCLYPGVRLDLGGIAKGWTSDRAVDSGRALLVSAGGDVRSALPDAKAEILDAADRITTTITIGSAGLATSSTGRRRWTVAGQPAHHIIDPRTGAPATSPVATASVIADTAVEAEAGAKAALILGDRGLAWVDRQPWLRSGLVTWHDGSAYATGSFPVAA